MAAATYNVYSSPYEGATVNLDYDDVTLRSSEITFVSGALAHRPLNYFFTISGTRHSGTIEVGAMGSFSVVLHGVADTDPHGGATIRWGIEPYGLSFS